MTSDDFVFLVLLIGSLALLLDYGGAGKFLLGIAREASAAGQPRPFIRGLGWELLTTIAFNWFWMLVLILSSIVTIPGPVLAVAHTVLVVVAITGRRRWWRQITPAVNGQHKPEEFPDNAP